MKASIKRKTHSTNILIIISMFLIFFLSSTFVLAGLDFGEEQISVASKTASDTGDGESQDSPSTEIPVAGAGSSGGKSFVVRKLSKDEMPLGDYLPAGRYGDETFNVYTTSVDNQEMYVLSTRGMDSVILVPKDNYNQMVDWQEQGYDVQLGDFPEVKLKRNGVIDTDQVIEETAMPLPASLNSEYKIEEGDVMQIDGNNFRIIRKGDDKKQYSIFSRSRQQATIMQDGDPITQPVIYDQYYDPETGEEVKTTVTRGDNKITFDKYGKMVSSEGEDDPYLNRIQNARRYRYVVGSFEKGAKWSEFSSILGMKDDFAEWKLTVDKIFHDAAFVTSDFWVENLCKANAEIEDDDAVMFTYNEDGILTASAAITATKQFIQSPEGNEWAYTVTYFLRNPDGSSSGGGLFKRGGSSDDDGDSGVIARGGSGSWTSADSGGLTGEEEDVWNAILDSGREIRSELSSTSRTSKNEDMEYNLIFKGDRTISLFTQNGILDTGDEVFRTADDSFATYSNYEYNEVCVEFYGEQPMDAFYQDVSEICTTIVDVTRNTPTELSGVDESGNRRTRGTRGDNTNNI